MNEEEKIVNKREVACHHAFYVCLLLLQSKRLVSTLKAISNPLDAIPTLKKSIKGILEICKLENNLDYAASTGAIQAVVTHLQALHANSNANAEQRPTVAGVEEVERDISFVLGLMAIKTEHQQAICDAAALPILVSIVKRYSGDDYITGSSLLHGTSAQTCRRAADAITNLAHENNTIKTLVRQEGGIPPLVSLLRTTEPKVQRAVAGTLRTLAFKNEENKNEIVNLGALPLLIQMLYSEDTSIHYEAVGVIGNLVHSSHHIKHRVLNEGALQAIINLLSSPCFDSQREAALLLGQFATADGDYKSKIVQRGAVPPLIDMLSSTDSQLREMAAFALGRLAQNSDNQAGIMASGGLPPLLRLLDSPIHNLQHNAAFALYGLSENEDNLIHFLRDGAIQKILESDLGPQASRDCVQKMTNRLRERLKGRIMGQILYVMQGCSGQAKREIAVAIGLLCSAADAQQKYPTPLDLKRAMIDRSVLSLLTEAVTDEKSSRAAQRQAAKALCCVAEVCGADEVKHDPVCKIEPAEPRVFLGTQYVNNKSLSDVTFIVEGEEFYAHKIALLSSSEIFRSMLDGGYREKNADSIPIPNIRREVFTAMMQCIYTGDVKVKPELAQELLQAADQYMLDGLKSRCEATIAQHLAPENVVAAFELAENLNAKELAKQCTLYCLKNYDAMLDETLCNTRSQGTTEEMPTNTSNNNVSVFARLMLRMAPVLEADLKSEILLAAEGPVSEVSDGMVVG